MSRALPNVIIDDAGVDVAYVEPQEAGGVGTLIVRPGQSFEFAVAAAARCLPQVHPDQLRGLLREHLTPTLDFESLLALPDDEDRTPGRVAPPRARSWIERHRAAVTAGAGAACGALLTVGVYTALAGMGALDTEDAPPPSPFDSPSFARVVSGAGWSCTDTSSLTAACTDAAGRPVTADASVVRRGVVYRFAWADREVYLGAFDTQERAASWTVSHVPDGYFDDLAFAGRYATWGNDDPKRRALLEAAETSGTAIVEDDADWIGNVGL